jgi:hypothetical protein
VGKDPFLKEFQQSLTLEIKRLFRDDWGLHEDAYLITPEYRGVPGTFKGYIDIGIHDNDNSNMLVAIEIEHRSSLLQSKQNIDKLKQWTHLSPKRSCGMLHIFNEGCIPDENNICDLVAHAKHNEKKNLGFHYDFMFYTTNDVPNIVATNLVDTKNFRSRLWQLLRYIGSA